MTEPENAIFRIGELLSGTYEITYLRGGRLVDASTVVAMSAGGSPTDVGLMLELGAQDFIPKGPELRGRVTRIVSILASSRAGPPRTSNTSE